MKKILINNNIVINIVIFICILLLIGIVVFSIFNWNLPNFKDSYLPLLVVVIGILPTVLITQISELNKIKFEKENREENRNYELYKKREEIYNNITESIRSFNALTNDSDKQKLFLATYQKSWLYCPDKIVQKIEEFIDAINVTTNKGVDHQKGNEIIQEIHLLMRRDLINLEKISETNLDWKNFKNVGVKS